MKQSKKLTSGPKIMKDLRLKSKEPLLINSLFASNVLAYEKSLT